MSDEQPSPPPMAVCGHCGAEIPPRHIHRCRTRHPYTRLAPDHAADSQAQKE